MDAQPHPRYERALGRLVALANRFFQKIESLYRFNAKFAGSRDTWSMRGRFGSLAGLAAMWAEGQLPKPRLRPAPLAIAAR